MIEPIRIIGTLLFLLSFAGMALHPSAAPAAERSREIRAGVLRNYSPEQYLDARTGKPSGLAIDVMDEVAKNAGLDVHYVLFEELAPALQALKDGRIDCLSGIGITEERTRDIAFSRPFDTFDIRIFIRESTTDIRGIDDLRGRSVAVVVDTTGFLAMQSYGKATSVVFRSLDEALLSLLTGNADALVSVEPPVRLIARKAGLAEQIKAIGSPLREVKRAIAVSRQRTDLLPVLDAAVQEVMSSPRFKEIYIKWYSAPAPYWNARRVSITAGILLVLIIVIFAAWHSYSLRRINRGLKRALERLKDTDARLRESEMRYRQIIEASRNMVWEVDASSVYTYVSPRVKDLLGYEPEEVIGKSLFDFMSDEEAGRIKPVFAALAAKREPFMNVENVNRHRDGRSVILETTGVPILDESGVFRGYRGINRDITERKRVEEDRLRLATAIDQSGEMVVMTDREGTIQYVNPAFERITGYSR